MTDVRTESDVGHIIIAPNFSSYLNFANLSIYLPPPKAQNMPQSFDEIFLDNATETLRAIAHPVRLLIIESLYNNKTLNVTEIFEALKIEQAVASHHLRILKNRNVLTVKRDGKNSFYALSDERYFHILATLKLTLG